MAATLSTHHISATNTLQVMWQNIATSFPMLYIANSDITVLSGLKGFPHIWSLSPTLSLDICEIFNISSFS